MKKKEKRTEIRRDLKAVAGEMERKRDKGWGRGKGIT